MTSHYLKKRGEKKGSDSIVKDAANEEPMSDYNEPILDYNEPSSDYEESISDMISNSGSSVHLQIEPAPPYNNSSFSFQCQNFINCKYQSTSKFKIKRHEKTCNKGKIAKEFSCQACQKRGTHAQIRKHLIDWKKSISKNRKSHIHEDTPIHSIDEYLKELEEIKKFNFS